MDLLALLLPIAFVHLSAVISPGPNFLIVTRNSLAYSRRIGLLTARGITLAAVVWISSGMLGFVAIVSQSALVFNLVKVLGTVYLVWMGLQTLFHKGGHTTPEAASAPVTPPTERQAVLGGVLTALSNPKGALYFLFLFTSMIPADTPPATKLLIAGMLLTISFGWYSTLALAFSSARIRGLYQRAGRWMNVAFGSLWIGLGIKLATTTR